MSTAPSTWKCPDLDYKLQNILALSEDSPYQIPMFAPMSSVLQLVDYDMYDAINRYINTGIDLSSGIAGRLVQPCTTEGHDIRTVAKNSPISLRCFMLKYTVCDLTKNPSYGNQEDINRVIVDARNTSLRQMEYLAYEGYSGIREPISDLAGLNGLKDIGEVKAGGVTLPIDPANYTDVCKFFTEGIEDVRKGDVTNGSEFSRSDVLVHVSRDIVDALNCAILASTSVSVWDQISNSVLSGVAGVVITEQINNSVYFVNLRRVFGRYNSPLALKREIPTPDMKTVYTMFAGTISFGKTIDVPVIYAEGVLDLS